MIGEDLGIAYLRAKLDELPPDEALAVLRAWLPRARGIVLPGEIDRALAIDDPGELAALPMQRWGPLRVDGSVPTRDTLHVILTAYVMSHPSVALTSVLAEWQRDAKAEGIPDSVARAARLALEREKAPVTEDTVFALARALARHAAAFVDRFGPQHRMTVAAWPTGLLATLPLVPAREAGFELAAGPGVIVGGPRTTGPIGPETVAAALRDLTDALEAVDRADDRTPLTEDGVPWLSAALSAYMRTELEADELADAWLKRERERTAEAAHPTLPIDLPPGYALPGWTLAVDDEALGPGWGVSAARLVLARAVWRAEVADRFEEQRYPTSSMLFPLTRAGAVNPTDRGGVWVVTAVDPDVLARLERSGALNTVESQALFRYLPDLARQAANVPGREVVVWSDGAAEVTVCMGGDHRTAVNVRGGWSAFAAALGFAGGYAQAALASAARGFAALPVRWSATDVANGTTSIILDIEERTADGRVSFALPRLLWPGFSTELKNANREREERRRVPVPPTLPPTTNPKLGAGPSRLELAAHAWIRDHLDSIVDELGAPVPWSDLADRVPLSTAKQRSRRDATLARLLDLWRAEGRWVRTDQDTDRPLWRPVYGWTGPGSLVEALEQVRRGREIQDRSRHRRKVSQKR